MRDINITIMLSVRDKLVRKWSPGSINVFSWSLSPNIYLKPVNNPVLCIVVKQWQFGSAVERISVPSFLSTVFYSSCIATDIPFLSNCYFLLVIKAQIVKVLSFKILIKIHRNQVLKQ